MNRLLSVILLTALSLLPLPSTARQDSPQKAEQANARKRLDDVRSQLATLNKQQAATAAQREDLGKQLEQQAVRLSDAAKALRITDQALTDRQQQLTRLTQQRDTLLAQLDHQRAALATLLRAEYMMGGTSDLRLLLGDQDAAQTGRMLFYAHALEANRQQRAQSLNDEVAHLDQLQQAIGTEQQALTKEKMDRAKQYQDLQRQRAEQQKLAAQVDAQYQNQAAKMAQLQQDEQSLNQLIATLQQAIDEAARQAAREAAAGSKSTMAAPGKPADIRGNLPWPASGTVTSYGNGVLIRADGGSAVHSVAHGKVVYAGFLRGYGMLLIINHGDGWMSMYGNNEALLKGVGDAVESGQTVSQAAVPSGVNTGVYFELRRHGKPVDPRQWLDKHR